MIRHLTKIYAEHRWEMEFAENGGEHLAKPPWYVIRLDWPFVWGDKPWFYWHDYLGPPVVFLTKRLANKEARALRKQYKEATVSVVEISVTEDKPKEKRMNNATHT